MLNVALFNVFTLFFLSYLFVFNKKSYFCSIIVYYHCIFVSLYSISVRFYCIFFSFISFFLFLLISLLFILYISILFFIFVLSLSTLLSCMFRFYSIFA